MFNAQALRKHSYLHKVLPPNPKQPAAMTNRYLYNAMDAAHIRHTPADAAYLQPLASMQPQSYGRRIDHTKARLAYGHGGLPQLCAQLSSPYAQVRRQALGTLTDELVDPEKCYRAVQKLRILPRLTQALRSEMEGDGGSERVTVERVMRCLQTIASHWEGARALVGIAELTELLFAVLLTRDDCQVETAGVLAQAGGFGPVAETMLANGHLVQTLAALQRWPDVVELYELLAEMTERSPKAALDAGCFEFLLPRLSTSGPCQSLVLKCFALAIQDDDGQCRCDAANVIPTLLAILDTYTPDEGDTMHTLDARPPSAHLEFAAMALHNCLIGTRSHWQAASLWHMAVVLARHAHCRHNRRLQMHCLQALRHCTEKPAVKQFVRTVCKHKLRRIDCTGAKGVARAKRALLRWLRYRNYHVEPALL